VIKNLIRRTWRELTSASPLYLMSTLTITLSLTIFSFFVLLYVNLEDFTNHLARELVLNVYLRPGTDLKECQNLVKELEKLPEVAKVSYINSQKVLKDLQKLFEDQDLLAGVSPDFLPPLLEVSFKRPFSVLYALPRMAEEIKRDPHVFKVQYAKSWLERLAGLKRFLEILSLTGLGLLGGATLFIAAATVRLVLLQRQEELEILSLVGATAGFIQGPVLLLAFIQALLATGGSLLILWVIHLYLTQALEGIFPGITVQISFFGPKEILILAGGVVLLCLNGSYWASRRFLRY